MTDSDSDDEGGLIADASRGGRRRGNDQYAPVPLSFDGFDNPAAAQRGGAAASPRAVCVAALFVAVTIWACAALYSAAVSPHRPGDVSSSAFMADPDPSMTGRRVVWLMSFPNSGTSYTGKVVRMSSHMSTATTYGLEGAVNNQTGENIPLREDSTEGPFLSGYSNDHPVAPKYVQTKTHCGGRCCRCGPDKYLETLDSFEKQCRTGKSYLPKEDRKDSKKTKSSTYRRDIVQRAIHLVRDPFDNIVSRFHLEFHSFASKNKTDFLERYPNSPEGFAAFCKDMDENKDFSAQESKSRFITEDLLELFKDVPCHGEFYKYIQWHNLAFETTDRMRLPTLLLHYEDYDTDLKGTVNRLLSFLELSWVGRNTPDFVKGKTYRDHYTAKQREAIWKLFRRVASPKTWDLIERYQEEQ